MCIRDSLYRYAYEQNQTLDGKGSYVDIDWNKFNEVGVKMCIRDRYRHHAITIAHQQKDII